jgi:RNA polymerase sigma factor (sigma-70 family)
MTAPGGDPARYLSSQPDEALVAFVMQGSEAAFEAIYDRHHRGLIAFCRHVLRSPEEAEDALQHTFAAAYRALTSGGERPNALKPWLYTIARNRCWTVLRARRTREDAAADTPADGAVVEGLADAVQRRTDLRELVDDLHRLPEDQRAALVLFEMGDHSHQEIAEVLDVKREKVKALVFQAREGLLRARTARDTPCIEIREHLSSRTRSLPRRGVIRGHLESCPSCAAYDLEVRRQRAALAIVLPVVPSLELKGSVLGPLVGGGATVAAGGAAAIGTGAIGTSAVGAGAAGAGGAGAAGAGAAGAGAAALAGGAGSGLTGGAAVGGLSALAANAVVAKVVTVVAVAGAAAGAGHVVKDRHDAAQHKPAAAAKKDVAARSRPATPKVVRAPAAPAVDEPTTTTAIPHQVVHQTVVQHTTTTSTPSAGATTATAPASTTKPATSQSPTDPTTPSTGGTPTPGTSAGGSAPATNPAPSTDAGASGSAPSTPPDTATPSTDPGPVVAADQLPPDTPAGTAPDPTAATPVTCPPGTVAVPVDPNAPPATSPSTDPTTAPPVPTVTLSDGSVVPIPDGCALKPVTAATAQDPAAIAATTDTQPAP